MNPLGNAAKLLLCRSAYSPATTILYVVTHLKVTFLSCLGAVGAHAPPIPALKSLILGAFP